jgi:hypothetical protein
VLTEQPHRLGFRHSILEAEAEEAYERQPVPDLELGGVVRQRVERLKDQDLEHENRVVGRATALRAIGPLQRGRQLRSECLEVYQRRELHQQIAFLRQALIALIQIEEPWLTHPSRPNADRARESRHRPARKGVFRGVRSQPLLRWRHLQQGGRPRQQDLPHERRRTSYHREQFWVNYINIL